ncbi:MAG: hypothetical protein V4657_12465 [Pseudomonadota bacterium]
MTNPNARKFAKAWTYRTPLLTIEYGVGDLCVNPDVLAAAQAAGVLEEEKADASDGPAKRSAPRRTLNLKG